MPDKFDLKVRFIQLGIALKREIKSRVLFLFQHYWLPVLQSFNSGNQKGNAHAKNTNYSK
jgi:hypothetical protein